MTNRIANAIKSDLLTANDRFSRLCSEIAGALRSNREGYEDIQAYGAPSECGRMVHQATQRELREILARYDTDPDTFYANLANRTSPRAAYYCGLDIRGFFC